MKRGLIAVILVLAPIPAAADNWFVQADLGAAHMPLDHVEDNDPVGALFTHNEKNGFGVIAPNVNQHPWGLTGDVSAGRFFGDFFVRGTYRHFGNRSAMANGFQFGNPLAVFPTPARALQTETVSPLLSQTINVSAGALFLGAGFEHQFGDRWFANISAEIGAASLRANGTRDPGTIIQQPFNTATKINLAYGAGAAVGYRFAPGWSAVLGINWDQFGRAETAWSPDIGGAPQVVEFIRRFGTDLPQRYNSASMRTGNLSATTITLGLRYSF